MVPSGAVTLLFTDIEGSTRAWEAFPEEMETALARHDVRVRSAIEGAGGYVFKTVGDAFCAAFADAVDALGAAVSAQRALRAEVWPEVTPIRVRMALHSGVCVERDGDYFGQPVNRVARLEATAHGGQVVVSNATAELIRGRLPAGVSLRDLGEHRLKDLGRPEWVFQVCEAGLDSDFEPLRSLSNPALVTNLPEQVSSFVGRERELDEVGSLVESTRLVTLAGPGGSGKTRLALQVAAELVDGSGDGVWLVELAGLADPALVALEVASVLGVREEAGAPRLDTLVEGLRDRNVLVVLDNCEHVIDATAKLAEAVLRGCPRVAVLATSREPLGIPGEHVYRVPSLQLPDTDERDPLALAASEAVQMFVERAGQQRPGFVLDPTNAATIARLCRRLDGIPLAIELATARVRSLSLDDIESRLDERFRLLSSGSRTALPRQQTLQALIDWSWDLLNPAEQTVLARLGVFAGGWDLDAATAIASGDAGAGGWDVADWEVVDHLDALVDKSLVQITDADGTAVRYRLLETVRDYANARLAEHGDPAVEAVRDAHAGHFLALAETAEPLLAGHDQIEWLDRLDAEQDNLRTALAHNLTHADPEPGLRLVTTLRRFWVFRGHANEAVEVLTALLDRPDAQRPTPLRGVALNTAADILIEVGELAAAYLRAEEALAIGRSTQDDQVLAIALSALSWLRCVQHEFDAAIALADEGLAVARGSGDAGVTALVLNTRGLVIGVGQGDPADARANFEEAVDLHHQSGNHLEALPVVSNLGVLELTAGDFSAARATLTMALATCRASNQPSDAMHCSFNLGLVEVLQGDLPAGRRLFNEVFEIARRIHSPQDIAYALLGVALTDPDPEAAASMHGAGDALLDRLGQLYEPFELDVRTADHARLRVELGDDAFDTAYGRGRDLSPDEAYALASP